MSVIRLSNSFRQHKKIFTMNNRMYFLIILLTVSFISCKKDSVKEKQPIKIAVDVQPQKMTYSVGDKFDPVGLAITVTYQGGDTKTITYPNNDIHFDYDFTKVSTSVGDKTVSIFYKDTKTTLKVTVTPPDVTINYDGNLIIIPWGTSSCAKRGISFTPGDPWTTDPNAMDTDKILGLPDYNFETDENYVTLGRNGVIVVEMGAYFTDDKGFDIYVFEVGPIVEATKVEVSADLNKWIYVGNAEGSLSGIDMNGKVPKGAKYKYIRLTDIRTSSDITYPGADIDAIVVLHPTFK